jgi:hypothetical protein
MVILLGVFWNNYYLPNLRNFLFIWCQCSYVLTDLANLSQIGSIIFDASSVLPRDPKLCDFSGKSAIHYVSQIESWRKQQLLDILMDSMPRPGQYFSLDADSPVWKFCLKSFFLFLRLFYSSVHLSVWDWISPLYPWNSVHRLSWPLTHRDPPASASQVLGSKVCAIILHFI